MMRAPLTLGRMLSAQARLQPARIGARDLDRVLSFAAWNDRACRLANGLAALGLTPGDRLVILAWNRVEWAELYAACAKAGIVAVPVNFRLTAEEIAYVVQDCGAAGFVAEAGLAALAEGVRALAPLQPGRRVLIGATQDGWQDYEALIAAAPGTEPDVEVGADDPWCLMYTSGTTGRPKGAIRSHRGMAMLAMMTEVELGLSRRDDALLVMPMCHANSLNFFTAFAFIGATVSIFNRASFDPAECLRAIGALGVTFTSLTPTHFVLMLDVPEAQRGAAGFERVAKLMISSAPARAETKRAVMAMFPNSGLYELYGSTEAGWVTFLHPDEQFDHLGTVGREVVGSAPIRLLDEDGHEVPDGQIGELFSCSPYQFDGYWNLPDKTREAMRGDHLSVGDMAIRDEQGFIRLVDRKKNMIITGGENVYPTEVEAALGTHPAVRDVAVVGQPDPKWGERVVAAVVLREGTSASAADLIAHARARLAGFKCPRAIAFLGIDEMPRNTTGKILHRVLRDTIAAKLTEPQG